MDIGGANDRTFTIPSLGYSDDDNYYVRVSNAVDATNSVSVHVTVLPPPATPPAIAGLVLHLPLMEILPTRQDAVTMVCRDSQDPVRAAMSLAPTFVSDAPLGQGVHYETQAINTGGTTSIATDAQYVTRSASGPICNLDSA